MRYRGRRLMVRTSAFQAGGCGFESHRPHKKEGKLDVIPYWPNWPYHRIAAAILSKAEGVPADEILDNAMWLYVKRMCGVEGDTWEEVIDNLKAGKTTRWWKIKYFFRCLYAIIRGGLFIVCTLFLIAPLTGLWSAAFIVEKARDVFKASYELEKEALGYGLTGRTPGSGPGNGGSNPPAPGPRSSTG